METLYEESYGVEFTSDWSARWWQFREWIQERKHRLFAGAKTSLSSRQLKPEGQSIAAANQRPSRAEGDAAPRGEKPVVPVTFPAKPKRYMIFPGAAAIRNGDALPKSWDKSQWID
jgi:hypothetical protein